MSLTKASSKLDSRCCMPNTNPTLDTAADIEFIYAAARRAQKARVLPLGTVTKGQLGRELSDMAEMDAAGAVAFSDDGKPVSDARLMRYALSLSRSHGKPVVDHCEDSAIANAGAINEGRISDLLGLPGLPAAAEEVMVARDIELARLSGGRLHLAHLSTRGSVDLVRRAKASGLPVTAEVTPHHLTLTEDWILGPPPRTDGRRAAPSAFDARAKVNPPLRTEADRSALVAALAEGIIDAIATDHAPHRSIDKTCTLEEAAFGISSLETALGSLMQLVRAGSLRLADVVRRLTVEPCRVFGLPYGSLRLGAPADLMIFDPDEAWQVNSADFYSKGKNTPLEHQTLYGRVKLTLLDGQVVHDARTGATR